MKTLLAFGIGTLLFFCPSVLKASGASICDSISGNLVQNCGFETGNLTDWNPVIGGGLSATTLPNSGTYAAFFVDPPANTISQTFSTTAGDIYDLSFYLGLTTTEFDAQYTNLGVFWDGTEIYDAPFVQFPYTQFSFTESGTGSDTLKFVGYATVGGYELDDVSLTPTPEPASMVLWGTGMLGMIFVMRKRLFA